MQTPIEPTYPHVEVNLSDGKNDPLSIVAVVSKALKKHQGVDSARRFTEEALASNNYHQVLELAKQTVTVL
jgi:hypothetical protein